MKHEGYPKGPWEIRPVLASELPHHLPLNGIYARGKLLATVGNYNHAGSENLARLIADAPRLAEENERLRDALQVAISHITGGSKFTRDFIWDEAEVLSILENALPTPKGGNSHEIHLRAHRRGLDGAA